MPVIQKLILYFIRKVEQNTYISQLNKELKQNKSLERQNSLKPKVKVYCEQNKNEIELVIKNPTENDYEIFYVSYDNFEDEKNRNLYSNDLCKVELNNCNEKQPKDIIIQLKDIDDNKWIVCFERYDEEPVYCRVSIDPC